MTDQSDHDARAARAVRTAEAHRRPIPPGALDRAVAHVRGGGLLVLPTDTVYGIAADAFSAAGQPLDAQRCRRQAAMW